MQPFGPHVTGTLLFWAPVGVRKLHNDLGLRLFFLILEVGNKTTQKIKETGSSYAQCINSSRTYKLNTSISCTNYYLIETNIHAHQFLENANHQWSTTPKAN
uniref:Uncharacterized protein n=1 Tax=Arundo donax TaxID=35708 RepID=A0A0A9EI62_ARUDO